MNRLIRPAAKADILRQFRFYLREGAPAAADDFVDAVDGSVEALCRMPEMGAPRPLTNPLLAGLRSWPVEGFEDLRIYYLVQLDVLRVVRVLHGKRDIVRILERERGQLP